MNFAHSYRINDELYGGHMTDHMWSDNGITLIWVLLWSALTVIAIIAALNYIRSSQAGHPDPMNELKTRYAKGEIDKKEYQSIKKELLKD